jgi:hypothetical protein
VPKLRIIEALVRSTIRLHVGVVRHRNFRILYKSIFEIQKGVSLYVLCNAQMFLYDGNFLTSE